MKKIVFLFITVISSLVMVILAIAVPVFLSVSATVKPKSIIKIVQQVDYEGIIEENDDLKKLAERVKLSPKAVDQIVKSEATGKIIEAYTNDAINILMQLPSENNFSAETVKAIAENNLNELVDTVAKSPNIKASEEKLRQQILDAVDKNAEKIVDALPSLKNVEQVVKNVDAVKMVKIFFNPWFSVLPICLILFLSILIFVLQDKSTKGFIWLGIDFAIATIGIAAIIILSKRTLISVVAPRFSAIYSKIIAESIYLCNDLLSIGFLIFSFLTLGCIFAYYYLKNKSENSNQALPSNDESSDDTSVVSQNDD